MHALLLNMMYWYNWYLLPLQSPDGSQPSEEEPVPEKTKRSRKDSSAYWKSLATRENKNDISFRPRKVRAAAKHECSSMVT